MEYTWKDEGEAGSGIQSGAVLLSAFPSAGLATLVAGHYMIRALKLPRVGRFDSPDIAPIAVVQGGQVNPTIRVYGRNDLGLVLSEFPPTPVQANVIARAIVAGAEARGARLVVCLEGVVPHPDEATPDDAPQPPPDEHVWAAFSSPDPAAHRMFAAARARPLEDGVIGGVSGALLVQSIGRSIPVVALLVSAQVAEGLPDHRAGAALIETLDRLLPELKIDTKPLREQAAQIERVLRAALQRRPQESPASAEAEAKGPGMYG